MKDIPVIMTRQEAQNILHLSKNSMLDLIHDKQIEASVVKGKYLITREALVEFIRNTLYN